MTYYDDALESRCSKRTLGVPLFQEQMLQMAMVMADFSGRRSRRAAPRAELSSLGRENAARRQSSSAAAMERKGVPPEMAERIVQAVGSFALYGFPESHAISFALLGLRQRLSEGASAPEFFAALLEQSADGLLFAGHTRERCQTSRRAGAAGLRRAIQLGVRSSSRMIRSAWACCKSKGFAANTPWP